MDWDALFKAANDAHTQRTKALMTMPRKEFDALRTQVEANCKRTNAMSFKGTKYRVLRNQMEMVAFQRDGSTLDEYKQMVRELADARRK